MTATRPNRTAQLTRSSAVGADEALTTLVGQFADPLVFLRELVQNSLDAASTQITVDTEFVADASAVGADATGMLTMTIADNGEGMNEHIIDNYLLTLFSSTKENDLTKIGKFGVGFVSVFAIEPALIVCETGQAGESWRVLFHADRSFEKMTVDEPLEGTTITLHKPMTRGGATGLAGKVAHTVRYWCKYAEADITVNGEDIREPLGLSAALTVTHREPGTSFVVGFAAVDDGLDESVLQLAGPAAAAAMKSLVGFYNRGLTLVEGVRLPDEHSADLAGLSMRVKSRYLEHTLTRDNVRADENYYKAIELVRSQVHQQLRPALVAHLTALAAHHSCSPPPEHPGEPAMTAALMYSRLPAISLAEHAADAAIIPTFGGHAISVRTLRQRHRGDDDVPIATEPSPVTARLAQQNVDVVKELPGLVGHLAAVELSCFDVHQRYVTAVPVDDAAEAAQVLLPRVDQLIADAKLKIESLAFGDLSYPASSVAEQLYIRQRKAFDLTEAGVDDTPTLLGGARDLVLNWSHPLVQHTVALVASHPVLAAHILAQAICIGERAEPKRRQAIGPKALAWHRERLGGATRE